MITAKTLFEGLEPILTKEGIDPREVGYCRPAIEILERRIAEGRVTDPSDYFWLGGAYNEAGDIDKTIEHTKTYTELVPDDPAGHHSLGCTYTRDTGETEEGKRSLEKAIELNPKNPAYRYELALNCSMRGDTEGNIENLRFVANSDPSEYPEDRYVIEDAQRRLSRLLEKLR